MNKAVGFRGSNGGRSSAKARSAQKCGAPSGMTRKSKRPGATNIRLVSSKRPSSIRSSQIVKAFSESGAGLRGWADEIGNYRPAGFNHSIAHPAHAPCMLDAVFVAKTEVARKVGAHGIGVEHNRIQERR
jgi:hypothetical protein